MGLLPTNLMNNSQKVLDLISARQEALADNVANVHTVGYKRKDVDFSQYLNQSTGSSLENKLIEKYGATPVSSMTEQGSIPVEDELALMQQNYVLYNVAAKQLKSTITQIKTAMNVSANG